LPIRFSKPRALNLRILNVNLIDIPLWCSAYEREPSEWLINSVNQLGVLSPISVRNAGHGRYELIDGIKRIKSCKKTGKLWVPCHVHNVDEKTAMLMRVALNFYGGGYRENILMIRNLLMRLYVGYRVTQKRISENTGIPKRLISSIIRGEMMVK